MKVAKGVFTFYYPVITIIIKIQKRNKIEPTTNDYIVPLGSHETRPPANHARVSLDLSVPLIFFFSTVVKWCYFVARQLSIAIIVSTQWQSNRLNVSNKHTLVGENFANVSIELKMVNRFHKYGCIVFQYKNVGMLWNEKTKLSLNQEY